MLGFRLTQGLFHLAIGIWLGALVMLVIAAATTFETVRAYEPTLGVAPYNAPELADGADGILAGAIVGNALQGLMTLQLLCAAGACAALGLQHGLFRDRLAQAGRSAACRARALLVLGAIGIVALNLVWIGPAVWEHRAVMYDATATVEQREAAATAFDRYHMLSERSHGLAALMLAGAILTAPFAGRATTGAPVPGSEPDE